MEGSRRRSSYPGGSRPLGAGRPVMQAGGR